MHTRTHAHTPRSSQDKQPSHSGPCASVYSLKALTAKKEKARPRLWCAPVFATCTLAGFDNTPLDPGKGTSVCFGSTVYEHEELMYFVSTKTKHYNLYSDEKCSDGCDCRDVVKNPSLDIIWVRAGVTSSGTFHHWLEAWKQVASRKTGKGRQSFEPQLKISWISLRRARRFLLLL